MAAVSAVAEDDDAVAVGVDLAGGVGHRHRLDAPGVRRAGCAASADARGPCVPHGDRGRSPAAVLTAGRRAFAPPRRLPLLPLAFHPLAPAATILSTASPQRRLPSVPRPADAVQELLAARVQRDVGAVAVLLARQHDLRRHRAVVQQPFELGELRDRRAAGARG